MFILFLSAYCSSALALAKANAVSAFVAAPFFFALRARQSRLFT